MSHREKIEELTKKAGNAWEQFEKQFDLSIALVRRDPKAAKSHAEGAQLCSSVYTAYRLRIAELEKRDEDTRKSEQVRRDMDKFEEEL